MNIRSIVLLVFLFSELVALSQDVAKSYYWVQLKDKKGTPYLISQPEKFLSQRAIARRARQQIAIDETDLPVSPVYLDSLKKRGLEIHHTSKWLNGTTVKTADAALMQKIAALPFVASVQLTRPANVLKSAKSKFDRNVPDENFDPADYGTAVGQLTQLNGEYLHNLGYRGKGIHVAVLDAGFLNVNQYAAFDSLRLKSRLLGTRDFVNPKSNIYQENRHGMSVLSCMAGNLPGKLVGTAPDASYYLFRTEQDPSEYLVEEDNWVAAAELADSLGVDVINSSLGYTVFDDPAMNHTYADLNGKTTRVTQGANMAFRKGILVFSSAGNEGAVSNPWKRIVAPSDGENVIAVGAVDKNGARAYFSSYGPAYGGATKPNVAATGLATYVVTRDGTLGYDSGTSFSSPVLAGMAACLLQANPGAKAKQIKNAIEQSAHQYTKPDSLLGYGIPDFEKADKYLKANLSKHLEKETAWEVWPNPFTDYLIVRNTEPDSAADCLVGIYNLQGVCLWQSTFQNAEQILLNNLSNLPQGFLIMTILAGEKAEQIKLIRVNR